MRTMLPFHAASAGSVGLLSPSVRLFCHVRPPSGDDMTFKRSSVPVHARKSRPLTNSSTGPLLLRSLSVRLLNQLRSVASVEVMTLRLRSLSVPVQAMKVRPDGANPPSNASDTALGVVSFGIVNLFAQS